MDITAYLIGCLFGSIGGAIWMYIWMQCRPMLQPLNTAGFDDEGYAPEPLPEWVEAIDLSDL